VSLIARLSITNPTPNVTIIENLVHLCLIREDNALPITNIPMFTSTKIKLLLDVFFIYLWFLLHHFCMSHVARKAFLNVSTLTTIWHSLHICWATCVTTLIPPNVATLTHSLLCASVSTCNLPPLPARIS
jgi:hypothetical protein